MKVPHGLRLSPAIEHLLKEFPERQEVQEHCMRMADGIQYLQKDLDILADALRNYAGENSCDNAHTLLEETEQIDIAFQTLISTCILMGMYHSLHHRHGGSTLEQQEGFEICVPELAQIKVELDARIKAAMQHAYEIDPIGHTLSVQEEIIRRGLDKVDPDKLN